MTTTADSLTTDQISAVKVAAEADGDTFLAQTCSEALEGFDAARAHVAARINAEENGATTERHPEPAKAPVSAPTIRASWSISPAFPSGWSVVVTVGKERLERFYGANGGEWKMRNGVQVGQIRGTLDIHAPAEATRFDRWVRRHLADDVATMRDEALR